MIGLAPKLRRGGGLVDSATLTVGSFGTGAYGYRFSTSVGSLSPDSTFNPKGQIYEFSWSPGSGTLLSLYTAEPGGGFGTNSGWSIWDISGTLFYRSAAFFTPGSGTCLWQWSPASNPFGTTAGATRNLKWY